MRPIPSLLALSLLLAPLAAAADAAAPLTIEQVMADPDWIGPPVESAWWAWNGAEVQYPLKRAGSPVRDVYRQPVDGGAAQPVADAARARSTPPTRCTTQTAAAWPSCATATCSCATCAAAR
jgi:hypothetical protein